VRARRQTGLGFVNSYEARMLSTPLTDEGRAMRTATDRAAEAIEAAEAMFAAEMGATLDLSRAVKVALISRIAAAIQAAVTQEREKLRCAR
jgi:hypothetical protein